MTVTVAVGLVPLTSTDDGEIVQPTPELVEAGGVHVRSTVPVKPLLASTVIFDVPEAPTEAIVMGSGLALKKKFGTGVNPGQLVTRTLASTDPKPLARS